MVVSYSGEHFIAKILFIIIALMGGQNEGLKISNPDRLICAPRCGAPDYILNSV